MESRDDFNYFYVNFCMKASGLKLGLWQLSFSPDASSFIALAT